MPLTSIENEKKLKLMADLAASWTSQQAKVNRSIAIQDHDLRDKLLGSITRLVLNIGIDLEMNNASKTFLGRLGDAISLQSGETEKKLKVLKKANKALLNPDALDNVNNSRIADIDGGVSVVPGVFNKDEWIASRLDAEDPFAIDPGFAFDVNFDAIDSAVKGYLKEIETGSEALPDYQRLCQQIHVGKLQSKKAAEDLLNLIDGKIKLSSPNPPTINTPQQSKRDASIFGKDLGL
jgi:hypothetical protein